MKKISSLPDGRQAISFLPDGRQEFPVEKEKINRDYPQVADSYEIRTEKRIYSYGFIGRDKIRKEKSVTNEIISGYQC